MPLRTSGGLIDCKTGVGHAHADTQIYGVARGKYIALRYIFICIYVQALALWLFRKKEKEEERHTDKYHSIIQQGGRRDNAFAHSHRAVRATLMCSTHIQKRLDCF